MQSEHGESASAPPASGSTSQFHVEPTENNRKSKAPSVRRACIACHSGKTRCSESLPCQSCLKRGLGDSCSYPDPDAPTQHTPQTPSSFAPAPVMYGQPQPIPPVQHEPATINQQQYYDYTFTGSTSTFRPNKRPRNLTEEEAQAITRNFTRGDFYVGNSAPVRIDPRLTVRLTLGEGDHVHFSVGETFTT